MEAAFKTTLLVLLLTLGACGQRSQDDHEGHQHAGDPVENEGNQTLYDEVMKIHDEVMPKMDDIYKLKESLKNKIATNPDIAEDEKKEIEATILELDSASEGMMAWMRQFNPVPDSAGAERAREYLETEMERVKKVREDILESIEKGEKLK